MSRSETEQRRQARVRRRRAASIGLAITLTVLVGIRALIDLQGVVGNSERVGRVLANSELLAGIGASINDAEAARTDYLLTGDERYLRDYRAAVSSAGGVAARIASLKASIAADALQALRVQTLESLLQEYVTSMEIAVARRQQGGALAEVTRLSSTREHLLNRTHRLINEIRREEELMLAAPAVNAARRARITYAEMAFAAIFSFVALGSSLHGLRREVADRRRAEAELAIVNADLDARVAVRTRELAHAKEALTAQIQRLTSLRTIDLAILGAVDPHLSMRVVLEQMQARLGADAVAGYLYDEATLTLRPFDAIGIEERLPEVHLGEGVSGRAAVERRTIGADDVSRLHLPPLLRALVQSERIEAIYATPAVSKGQLLGTCLVMFRTPFRADDDWLRFFEAIAGQAAMAIDAGQSLERLQRAHLDLELAYDRTMEGWSRALDLRDKETEGHTRRVTELTLRLARRAGLTHSELRNIRYGALLHDIGKIGVPDSILLKKGALTGEERAVMSRHPIIAYELLAPVAYLRPALDIPYCHHERWDGSGYPRGLKGDQIPLAARLFAVADVWDALLSDRPYRTRWAPARALEHIKQGAGTHFDPTVVELFLALMAEEDGGRADTSHYSPGGI